MGQPITYVVPFSHLDLFWAGTREECLSRGNNIIRNALDLLEKHEDFRFLLETMNFVEHFLSCFPAEKPRLAKLLAAGRLELGPAWSGIYLNLPGGETLCRNILLAKAYAKRELGADPAIAHFGDLPGYTPQYPQIAAKAGLKGLLMSRGGPGSTPLFKWRAPDGSETTAYYAARGYAAYNGLSSPYEQLSTEVLPQWQGTWEQMFDRDAKDKPYPLLVHWGMDLWCPPERLVHNIRSWNQEKRRELRFCTLGEYFAAADNGAPLPSLAGELPSAWPNIESSWPDIWPEDLPCEAALHLAEFLSSLCLLHGWDDYPAAELEQAWKALLDGMDHNQNSQGGDIADQDKLQLKLWAKATAERVSTRMAWRLAAQVKAPHPDAFPVVVFNPLSWRRSGAVIGRAAVFGPVSTNESPGKEPNLKLIDAAGNTIPFVQLQRLECVSSALEIAFPIQNIPAAGYQTYYLVPGENPKGHTCAITLDSDIDAKTPQRNQGSNTYENQSLRLEIDAVTGEATLHDLKLGKPLFTKMAIIGEEERRGNYISDMTPSGRLFPAVLKSVETLDNNSVWCRVQVKGEIYGMPFIQTYTLFHDSADLLLENEIDWTAPRWIRLQQTFPGDTSATIRYGVPFGQVAFPETMGELTKNCFDELDLDLRRRLRLCRHWVDVGNDADGVTIGCDHRMWDFDAGLPRSYMIRGCGFCGAVTVEPDGKRGSAARPPSGKYRFRYLLRPRHRSLADSSSYRCGWELNHPTRQVAVCDPNPEGKFPASSSLLDFTDASVVVTAVKRAEDGNGVVVRAFESAGREAEAELHAVETDILEQGATPVPDGKLKFKPFEIKTLRLQGDRP